MTTSGRQMPEVLHYVVWFNYQREDYEAIAVFNTKLEAEIYVADFNEWSKQSGRKDCVTIISWTWSQFLEFAKSQIKVKAASDPFVTTKRLPRKYALQFPESWSHEQIADFKRSIEAVLPQNEKIVLIEDEDNSNTGAVS